MKKLMTMKMKNENMRTSDDKLNMHGVRVEAILVPPSGTKSNDHIIMLNNEPLNSSSIPVNKDTDKDTSTSNLT